MRKRESRPTVDDRLEPRVLLSMTLPRPITTHAEVVAIQAKRKKPKAPAPLPSATTSGALLMAVNDAMRGALDDAKTRFQRATESTGRPVDIIGDLMGRIGDLQARLAEQNALIAPLVSGQVAKVKLGTVKGRSVALTRTSLGQIDHALIVALNGLTEPTVAAASATGGRAGRGRGMVHALDEDTDYLHSIAQGPLKQLVTWGAGGIVDAGKRVRDAFTPYIGTVGTLVLGPAGGAAAATAAYAAVTATTIGMATAVEGTAKKMGELIGVKIPGVSPTAEFVRQTLGEQTAQRDRLSDITSKLRPKGQGGAVVTNTEGTVSLVGDALDPDALAPVSTVLGLGQLVKVETEIGLRNLSRRLDDRGPAAYVHLADTSGDPVGQVGVLDASLDASDYELYNQLLQVVGLMELIDPDGPGGAPPQYNFQLNDGSVDPDTIYYAYRPSQVSDAYNTPSPDAVVQFSRATSEWTTPSSSSTSPYRAGQTYSYDDNAKK